MRDRRTALAGRTIIHLNIGSYLRGNTNKGVHRGPIPMLDTRCECSIRQDRLIEHKLIDTISEIIIFEKDRSDSFAGLPNARVSGARHD